MAREREPRPQIAEYAERAEIRLVPQEAPNREILLGLIDVIRRVQQGPLRLVCQEEFENATPEEAPEQFQAIARAVVRMEQIAAESQAEGERLKKIVETQGPRAAERAVRAAESAIINAVRFCQSHGLRIEAEPLE
jgi:hypothetical protein